MLWLLSRPMPNKAKYAVYRVTEPGRRHFKYISRTNIVQKEQKRTEIGLLSYPNYGSYLAGAQGLES